MVTSKINLIKRDNSGTSRKYGHRFRMAYHLQERHNLLPVERDHIWTNTKSHAINFETLKEV